jgi:hypothetical protein
MRMMRSRLVLSLFVMLRGLAVMLGGFMVVFGCIVMVSAGGVFLRNFC